MKVLYFLAIITLLACTSSSTKSIEETTSMFVHQEINKQQSIPEPLPPIDTLLETAHFIFMGKDSSFQSEAIKEMGNTCEATLKNLETFCEQQLSTQKIQYYLYPTSEAKGLLLSNTDQSNVSFKDNHVHSVFNEEFKDNFLQKENELIIRHLLGKPSHWFLENGLGLYFTKKWQKKGYAYWAKVLFQSKNAMPLSDLFNEKLYQNESTFVKGAMAGSFVEFLIQKWGKDKFLKEYNSWSPTPAKLLTLEKEWHQFMAQKEDVQLSTPNTPYDYWQGFNFAHEGYNIYNGYISEESSRSLKKLHKINSNAIAIVPYSYMKSPHQPTFFRLTNHPGSENDESVIHVIYAARKLGIQSLLKPQVWLGSGSWSGFVEMESPEEWDQFFDYYYRWIRHYAMLAEIHGVEALSVGVEFGKATVGHEEEWKKIFQKLRGIYSGKLTYCANWGEEFEQLTFWNELDFIGLNCYYPLSKNTSASTTELTAGFKKITAKVEKISRQFNKPIIFTEIGFRPVEQTWVNPHEDHQDRAFNEEEQRRCYEIVFKGLENQDWCKGILWWKWPSYMEYSNRRKRGFSPHDRVTEQLVEEWFKKNDNQILKAK